MLNKWLKHLYIYTTIMVLLIIVLMRHGIAYVNVANQKFEMEAWLSSSYPLQFSYSFLCLWGIALLIALLCIGFEVYIAKGNGES